MHWYTKVGSSELHKRVAFEVVITVVSLLFPKSSKRGPKVTFLAMSEVLVTNYFFRVNERKKGMD